MKSIAQSIGLLFLLFSIGCQKQQTLTMPATESPASVDLSSTRSSGINALYQLCEGDTIERIGKRVAKLERRGSLRLNQQIDQIIHDESRIDQVAPQLKCLMQKIPPLIKE